MDTNTTTKQKKPTQRANAGWAKGQKGTTKKRAGSQLDAAKCGFQAPNLMCQAAAHRMLKHLDRLICCSFNSVIRRLCGGLCVFEFKNKAPRLRKAARAPVAHYVLGHTQCARKRIDAALGLNGGLKDVHTPKLYHYSVNQVNTKVLHISDLLLICQ